MTVPLIVSPLVQAAAQSFYNCSSIPGAEIEVLSGLEGSEEIITNPGERLAEGLEVRVLRPTCVLQAEVPSPQRVAREAPLRATLCPIQSPIQSPLIHTHIYFVTNFGLQSARPNTARAPS